MIKIAEQLEPGDFIDLLSDTYMVETAFSFRTKTQLKLSKDNERPFFINVPRKREYNVT